MTPKSDDMKKPQKSAQNRNDLFRTAIEALPHPFYVIDAHTFAIKIANRATSIFGDVKEGTTCYALTHNRTTPCSGENYQCPLLLVKENKKPARVEHKHIDRHGQCRHYELYGYPIFDERGEVEQMIEYSLDITERRKTEAALQKAYEELENRVQERTASLNALNEQLQLKINEQHETETQLRQHQHKLQLLASQLTLAEEQQRRQLAIDLHDSVGQSLALLQMKLSEISRESAAESLQNKLAASRELLEQIVQDIRSLSFELSPPLLYDLGLEAAIDWLAETFQQRYNLDITVDDDGIEKSIDKKIRLILFRIVRELMMNIVKHAQATAVSICIQHSDKHITININDDGVGFSPADYVDNAKSDRFGLFSVRERLSYLGGHLTVQSEARKGTHIKVKAPLLAVQKNLSRSYEHQNFTGG